MSVRVSPYLLSLIDWTNPYDDPLRHAVHPARLAPPARPPEARPRLAARARRHAGAGAHPPLRRQGAVPARSTPARSTAASARAATRSASTPKRSRSSSSRSTPSAGSRRSPTSARAPSSRTSSSRAATPTSCAPSRSPQIGETLLGDRPRPPHALRDQGAGGHAAEDPHRRRLDRRAHRASSSRGASCTRRW